ncbi:hypothetical protein GCM10027036_37000 [Flavihumibacter cheonanensis]|uniref:hypothetical protein n=1 Tax=Flavihumibacter cheonanensis TaxID=1442385 RepID=UPI001EF8C7B1|nr:hypothetical protein [Flavihumibacter cheonanensis]MCG7753703.1 hypothetical protein [Flavihumibacter cheonanensis]
MGAFFTNIQIKIDLLKKENLIEEIVFCLKQYNSELDYEPIDNQDEADKSVLIVSKPDSNWVSIYDEDTELQHLTDLKQLAKFLSSSIKTSTLSILVHDSDSISMCLFTNGKEVDSISNIRKKVNFNKNKPEAWSDVLHPPHIFEDIQKAWHNNPIFAEEFLQAFAQLARINSAYLISGFEDIQEFHKNDGIALHFRQKNKPIKPVLPLTTFQFFQTHSILTLKKGESSKLDFSFWNRGDSSKGIEIILAGECIDKNLLVPKKTEILYIERPDNRRNNFQAAFTKSKNWKGEYFYSATIEEIIIPKGHNPQFPMKPKESKWHSKNFVYFTLFLSIVFESNSDEPGRVDLFICPLENKDLGYIHCSFDKITE